MSVRKSLANCAVELQSHDDGAPLSSSPLRYSLANQTRNCIELSENNDEAERRARRSDNTTINNGARSNNRKRWSLTPALQLSESQIAERISQCIKLNAQNRINAKNAFGLEIIDFMTYMIKKQDINISNLQVATTSLDVSTKIYGFRVDCVYTDALQITSGTEKQGKNKQNTEDGENEDLDEITTENDQAALQTKKKKKRNKRKILSSIESLRGNVETVNPVFMMRGDSDLQTSDTLCQVTLPVHANSGFYLHEFNDVLHDKIEQTDVEESLLAEIPIKPVEDIADTKICSSFDTFQFLGWSADNEMDETNEEENENVNCFQFNLDASLPSDNNAGVSGPDFFGLEDEEHTEINRFKNNPNRVENLVDFREVLNLPDVAKTSEYTFVNQDLNIHWAGPSHWKIKQFNRSNNSVLNGCAQKPVRKRREMELVYDGVTLNAIKPKFQPGKNIKLRAKTTRIDWQQNRLTLPPDVQYEFKAIKLYDRPDISVKCNADSKEQGTIDPQENNYNYENPNDTLDYCSNINDDYHTDDDNNGIDAENCVMRLEGDEAGTLMPLTGENLITLPRTINKEVIPFCVRAKKIDMRQLKDSIWKNINSTDNNANVDKELQPNQENQNQETVNSTEGGKRFGDIYKALPNSLSKDNVEALSFPVAFASLLHLANERSLKLSTVEDMSDIIIRTGKE